MSENVHGLPDNYPKVYGFWTNKGGVGKTTLTFQMATTYAKLFPQKAVVAIDMCPQCNLSATFLTKNTQNVRVSGADVVKDHQTRIRATDGSPTPKTIGGYFMSLISGTRAASAVKPKDFLIPVYAGNFNNHIPRNMYLVCGDSNLDSVAPRLNTLASGDISDIGNPFVDVHHYLLDFIHRLQHHFAKEKKELVVFIDTSPALSIYTQIALCAMTNLVIPVNADTFSLQAVSNMYNLVYGLYPAEGVARQFEKGMFAHKAKEYGVNLPKITCIIHNHNPITKNMGPQPPRVTRAHKAMATEQVGLLYDGYQRAQSNDTLTRVFDVVSEPDGARRVYNSQQDFAVAYTATIRDMRSCGVAAVHSGLPIWKLIDQANNVDPQFRDINFRESVPGLIKDLMYAMEVMLGPDWDNVEEGAKQELQDIADNV